MEKRILERFKSECGSEFVEASVDIINQHLKSKTLQRELTTEMNSKSNLQGLDVDIMVISHSVWPFASSKGYETDIEPVAYDTNHSSNQSPKSTDTCISKLNRMEISNFILNFAYAASTFISMGRCACLRT